MGEYAYDAFGRRVKKIASGVTTLYHYAGGNLIAETDENGVTLRDYIYLNGEPAALRIYGAQFGTMYYFVNDHLGTPQKIVDGTNQVVWAAAYLPFGKAQIKPETITNNLRFPGQYYDAETGLHYNWNRYYDPDTGRYITADPIGLSGGINLYAYVMGNPVNFTDQSGLYIHKPGGPYHPPVKTKCYGSDSCSTLAGKKQLLMKSIKSHTGWMRHHPGDFMNRGHAEEIDSFWRAWARCEEIYSKKNCDDCQNNSPWNRFNDFMQKNWPKKPSSPNIPILPIPGPGGSLFLPLSDCLISAEKISLILSDYYIINRRQFQADRICILRGDYYEKTQFAVRYDNQSFFKLSEADKII